MTNEEIRHNFILSEGFKITRDDDYVIQYTKDERNITLYKVDGSYSIGGYDDYTLYSIGGYDDYTFGTMVRRVWGSIDLYNSYRDKVIKLDKRSETIKRILKHSDSSV